MSTRQLVSNDVEQDRLEQAAVLAADAGDDWAVAYKPGSFGCHELLDRTAMLADMVEQHIQTHPSCVANPEWFRLAEQAASALRELYQQVGGAHLTEPEA